MSKAAHKSASEVKPYLSRQTELLNLANQRIQDELRLHVIGALQHAVDTKVRRVLLDLEQQDGRSEHNRNHRRLQN
jgi:hypothetical protein